MLFGEQLPTGSILGQNKMNYGQRRLHIRVIHYNDRRRLVPLMMARNVAPEHEKEASFCGGRVSSIVPQL